MSNYVYRTFALGCGHAGSVLRDELESLVHELWESQALGIQDVDMVKIVRCSAWSGMCFILQAVVSSMSCEALSGRRRDLLDPLR